MIEPLRKRRSGGRLYERRVEISALLVDLCTLTEEELIRRAQIGAKSDPQFMPSECLLHLVRRSKRNNTDRIFEALFRALFARVENSATLRTGQRHLADGTVTESKHATDVREYVVDRFVTRLANDRNGYDDHLDYFEVNFAHAMASLRLTAERKVISDARKHEPLSTSDDETISAEVEKAAGSFDPFGGEKMEDRDYRSTLFRAIRELPEKERQVVLLLFKDYPIESKDPNSRDICTILGCVEKTVRNRRDRAFAKLRLSLSKEQIDA